ncbi:VOC family protein [Corynebacterium lizhenjunii]|uniref:VOC family protein n=1 Tax=Corynebacterium lizhenjunii TaxID=2709394 RepID=A0A7T0KE47_9CORY|nr:VOC family protein [Corynebacterium lizhenjunii]QPK79116.1 VOC family protein [Corynebacterium lizhenjunii]
MRTTQLKRIGVVVSDLDQAVASYGKIYGIQSWQFADAAPADATSHGRRTLRTPGTWRSALGTTLPQEDAPGPFGNPAQSVTFELIQPTGGETPFNEQLLSKGEGITFIQVAAEGGDPAEHFAQLGITAAYSASIGGQCRTWWDTRKQLGGFYVEMVPVDAPAAEPAPADTALLPAQGIYHFGVLVDDVMEVLPHYRDIFGLESFDMKTWESGEGRLDAPQYRGNTDPVGYFTAQAHAQDFGFEIISMKYGSCHYNREFLDHRGPGIHHIFAWMTTQEQQWEELTSAMTAAGYPVVMGSPLRAGAAEFGYFDTFDALGGYLVEIVIRRFQGKPEHMSPDWIVDYSEAV